MEDELKQIQEAQRTMDAERRDSAAILESLRTHATSLQSNLEQVQAQLGEEGSEIRLALTLRPRWLIVPGSFGIVSRPSMWRPTTANR